MKIWIGQALLKHLDSWSKFTLRPTAVESYHLSNFRFLNEEIDPQNGIYSKNWARQVLLENFDFLVKICAKVNFLGIGQFAQFSIFKWRNGSQNRNVLEKLNGTGHFWNFWLFGQSQSFTRSKLFIYLFFCKWFGPGQDEWVKSGWPGQMSQTGVVEDDVIHDVIALWVCVNASMWENANMCERVTGSSCTCCRRQPPPDLLVVRGGACLGFWAWNFQVL